MAERTVAPKERVNITYKPAGDSQSEEELPLKMLFIGEYTGRQDNRPLEQRQPINIDKDNFQQVLANQNIVIDVVVPNVLTDEANAPNLAVKLRITKLADFAPDAVAEQIPDVKRLLELRDALTALKDPRGNLPAFRRYLQSLDTKPGIETRITELLAPEHADDEIDKALTDAIIAQLDQKIAKQVDHVLHTPEFQKVESAWRGLKFVVDRTDFRENIKCEVLDCTKEDLITDLEDAPEIPKSGLYKLVYTSEYGSFGGKPYGAVFSNYEIGPTPRDVALLQKTAAVAAMAHAPFFAAASSQFFGQKSFLTLPNLKDLDAVFEGPQYAKWRSFRDSDDSRYIGLLCPKFLLRLPYGPTTTPVKRFNFEEDVGGSHDHYLWGNSTYAFATRIADSFAKYRWCPNIIGPAAGGTVDDLPLHQYASMGALQSKVPTEIMLTERREYELSEQGFIALTYRKDSDSAAFFSANSAQKPKSFGQSPDAKELELNYKLGTQLPYMFVACRIAHYLKVIQREQIGTGKERSELEAALNDWIRQYVADMDAASAQVRGKRPLRQAQIKVTDVPGNAGWYKIDMKVRPHFKYMGAFFTLSLAGKIDKEVK